ncbi:hypothetical protein Ga0123462_0724 [Mariprofundus ferrinatatus]|uniref:DUF4440 domain-containing protein n=1 Tax=Mariprofundus ferrinatatus TaxID=1921087 RepID=A0A2K8L9H8_9PROT|nr:hypothetical protein [Mariprofundus ferrinatatus]ATX81594.1 hypothetical protein Ga0123462_0724 [Mariprofundus ferrinatatus]
MALLLLCSCDNERQAIHQTLDAREAAIRSQDINSYKSLLHPDYGDKNQSAAEATARMKRLFTQFDAMEMGSSDRTIYMIDDEHALCEQSYRLKVKADNMWRETTQRERIELTRTVQGWKISGGLY